MDLKIPDPGEKIVLTCNACGTSISYSKLYIGLNLAKCTSRKCRAPVSEISATLIKALGYQFLRTEIKSKRVVSFFICNNGHSASMYFEKLRNGSVCKVCTRLRTDFSNRTRPIEKIKLISPNKRSCDCHAIGKMYGNRSTLCEHYNFKALCPKGAAEWSDLNIIKPENVAPKSNESYYFLCPKCNQTYTCVASDKFDGAGCSYCNGNHNVSIDRSLGKLHPDLCSEWSPENEMSPYEIFAGSDKRVKWVCKCGHKWETKCYTRTTSGTGCPKCNGNGLTAAMGAHDQFVHESSLIHDNKYTYPEEYKTSNTKIKIICPMHGEFMQVPSDHRAGHGCYKCGLGRRMTGPVKNILAVLELNGYEYDTEMSFPGLKNINALSIDVYVPKLRLMIEYDGKQHFYPVESWGGQESLEKNMKRDLIKDKYAIHNKYSIARFSYKNDDMLEEFTASVIKLAKDRLIYITYPHYLNAVKSEKSFDLEQYLVIENIVYM